MRGVSHRKPQLREPCQSSPHYVFWGSWKVWAIATTEISPLMFADVLDDCNTVIAFYATSLHHLVGADYQPPRLASLARHWFESSSRRDFTTISFDTLTHPYRWIAASCSTSGGCWDRPNVWGRDYHLSRTVATWLWALFYEPVIVAKFYYSALLATRRW